MISTTIIGRLAGVLTLSIALQMSAMAAEDTALGIMQKSAAAIKLKDSVFKATFTLVNRDGSTRIRQTSAYTRLQGDGTDNMRLVRFLAPADIKGTATLLIEHTASDDDMWIYLPALGKVRRLSASNKKDSFVGTDFSYGDVIGYKPEEWSHRQLREESEGSQPCYVIESLPGTDAVKQNSGQSKRVTWVRKDNFVAIKSEAWDTSGQLARRITLSDVRPVGSNGRWQAMVSEAQNLLTEHKTTIKYEEFQVDQNVPEKMFNPRELDR
jgi:outer membrane lipoprotein-sorting protein